MQRAPRPGLKVDVHVPQQSTLEEGALGEADVRSTTVTLPAGVQLNPSAANGLQACSEQQIGYEGPAGPDPLSEGAPQPLRFSSEPADCPDASKVGTVRVAHAAARTRTAGAVYLAAKTPTHSVHCSRCISSLKTRSPGCVSSSLAKSS